jgi:triosephosphate isomerase
LIINNQLEAIKEILDETEWNKVIIAYEPIWAMNTGTISSYDQT